MNKKASNIYGTARTGGRRTVLLTLLVAALLALLALLIWGSSGFSLRSGLEAPRESNPVVRNNVWYGPRRSIAVLTLADLSPGDDQPWLSEGVTRELIEMLESVPRIQVTSHSSSWFFKGRSDTVPAIAERLTVAHILQGGISETDEGFQVTVRLTRAKSEELLWSESWAVERDGIFSVLNEIVTKVLETVIDGVRAQVPVAQGTDVDAWASYLRGRYFADRLAPRKPETAEKHYRAALEIEPGFAPAWAGLASVYLRLAGAMETAGGNGFSTAREMAQTALELDPAPAEGYEVISYIRRLHDWDWEGATHAAERALELRPGSARLMSLLSMNEFTLGRFEQAIETLQQAIKRDPLQLLYRLRLGLLYEFSGDYSEALSTYTHLLSLSPGYPAAHAYRGRAKIARGDAQGALAEADKETVAFWQLYLRILALSGLGRNDEAAPMLLEMIESHKDDAAFQIAEIHAYRGEADLAFQWLHRARDQRDGGMTETAGNPLFSRLWQDSRWAEMMASLGLPPRVQSSAE